MRSIFLVRHGPVALKAPGLLSFPEFVDYCDKYELSGIAPGAPPPNQTVALVRNATSIFASPATRARQSIDALGVEGAIFDSRFREEPNVAPSIAGRWPLIFWFAASRGRGAFHPAAALARDEMRRRARAAAAILSDATADGTAALIGHGWFNRAIARALTADNWRRTRPEAAASLGGVANPWGYAVFER